MINLDNNKIGDVFTSPITGKQIIVAPSVCVCEGCIFHDIKMGSCTSNKEKLGFTGTSKACHGRIFKNMNPISLIKPGDFVKIAESDNWYLCLSDTIFASKEMGWRDDISNKTIIKILRPRMGFGMERYWKYLEDNDWISTFTVIYSSVIEYTVSDLEIKLGMTPGTLRIKK